ncbi:MAG: hypothetical protein EOP50_12730, partial [Sphingobacteriales bacterium]
PDKHNGSPEFEARFKQINEAYQVLSDPRKKQLYDFKLQYSNPAPTNFGARSPYQAATMYRHANGPKPEGSYQKRTYTPPPQPKQPAEARNRANSNPYQRTWRDYGVVLLVFISLLGFGLVVKYTMDHISAISNYETALDQINQKQYRAAHENLQAAVHFKPAFGEAYLKMADLELTVFNAALAAQRNYSAAFHHLENVTPQNYYMRAKSFIQTRRFAEAEADLTMALTMDSTLALASLDRGIIRLEHLGKVRESVQDFGRYIYYGTDTVLIAHAHRLRGIARHLISDFEGGRKDFDQSIKMDPENPVSYALMGDLQLSLQDTAMACTYFTMAYNLGDNSAINSLTKYCRKKEETKPAEGKKHSATP